MNKIVGIAARSQFSNNLLTEYLLDKLEKVWYNDYSKEKELIRMMTDKKEASAFIIKEWKDRGKSIVDYIATLDITPKPLDSFWEHCTACGGNWNGLILTGIKELYPEIWDMIPDKMGVFAFSILCEVLNLLGYED